MLHRVAGHLAAAGENMSLNVLATHRAQELPGPDRPVQEIRDLLRMVLAGRLGQAAYFQQKTSVVAAQLCKTIAVRFRAEALPGD